MDSSSAFKQDDFVWAKMTGFSHWPAIVMKPDPDAPIRPMKEMQWVYFLGTHNYGWIEDKNIKPYQECKSMYKKKSIQKAMNEMEEIMANRVNDPNYKIEFVKYLSKESSPKKAARKSSVGVASAEKKRPLKEKNTPVLKKKPKKSLSRENEDLIIEREPHADAENSYDTNRPVVLNTVNVGTSNKFFGVLAGSVNSEGIIKNLIKSGHKLYVWSRSSSLCDELEDYAAKQKTFFKVCDTAKQVVRSSDITFSCLADADEAKTVVCQLSIADDLLKNKSFVEMTSLDPDTSQNHAALFPKDCLYMEAMLQGNRQEAEKGELIILAAGDQSVFLECQSCFKAMGKASLLLGKVGTASKIHMIFQMMRGIFLAALAEGFAMADRCSIKLDVFNNIFRMTQLSSSYLRSKSETIVNKKYSDTEEPLEQLQKDLAMGLDMSNVFRQPMPLASNANEILKHARRLGCDNQDSACIYNRTRY